MSQPCRRKQLGARPRGEGNRAVTGGEPRLDEAAAPTIVGIIHEGIPVKDLAASMKFYKDVLGLRELPRPNLPVPGAWLGGENGAVQVHLIVGDDYVPGPEAKVSPTGRHTAFFVDDLGVLRARLRENGIEHEVLTGLVGGDQVMVKDPDGHTLEFQQVR